METEDAFWIPNLSDSEIMDALDAWGVKATPKLISKPTEDFTKAIYGKCLEMVFGITSEMLEEAVEASLVGIRPENMVRSLSMLVSSLLNISRRILAERELI